MLYSTSQRYVLKTKLQQNQNKNVTKTQRNSNKIKTLVKQNHDFIAVLF